jgi:hypothetical protein
MFTKLNLNNDLIEPIEKEVDIEVKKYKLIRKKCYII